MEEPRFSGRASNDRGSQISIQVLEYLTRSLNTEVRHLTRFLNIVVGYSNKGVELHEYCFEDRKYKTKYR